MERFISTHNPTGMWGEVALLTPDLAATFLARNHGNRPLGKRNLDYLADMVISGRWRLNGEAIKFDTNGDLRDGQHRCRMVVETGVAVPVYILHDVPDDAFGTFDRGRKRANSDVLHILGESACTRLAGALGWVWRWKNDIMHGNRVPCVEDCVATLADHGGIREFVSGGPASSLAGILPFSISIALRYMTSLIDRTRADAFWMAVASGENIRRGMPEYVLRMRLVDNKIAKAKLPPRELVAICIKAWNKRDSPCSRLRWRRTGDSPEPFPALK